MKKQLLANNIASAGSIFWRVIGLLLIPAALIGWWGPVRYGEWIYLMSLPTLLAVADLGFADAAASQMTMEIAKGNTAEAIKIFQTICAITFTLSMLLVVAGVPLLFLKHLKIGLTEFGADELKAAFAIVCLTSLLILSKLFLACLRAGQFYAPSTLIYDVIQFMEGVGILCAAYAGREFLFCAMVAVSIRAINVAFLATFIARRMHWLPWGFKFIDFKKARELLPPALAAMAIPTALALNFQGMIWISGSAIGPAAAATLATVRTASRVIIQLVGIFSRAAMPIYSASVAVNNTSSRGVIERVMRILLVTALAPGCLLFGLFGRQFVGLWTRGHIDPPTNFVWMMAVVAMLHGSWVFRANLLVSINRHVRFGGVLVIITFSFILLGWPSAELFGLDGVAGNLIGLELVTLLALMLLGRPPGALTMVNSVT
jgi:O-antigen/teichoic acid export membrane protein